jgi:N-acetylneuraminic acid mutarotase
VRSSRSILPILLVLALLAGAAVVSGCGAQLGTTTTSAAPPTTAQTSTTTTTTQAVTTTTLPPTTTTESETLKLELYRHEMTELWYEYDPKLATMINDLTALGSGSISPTDALNGLQQMGNMYRAFLSALEKAQPPQTLATAHATYLSGLQKMSAAIDRLVEAMREDLSTQKASGTLAAVAALLKVIEDENESMTAAEETLRTALGVEMPPGLPNTWLDLSPSALPVGCFYSPMALDPRTGAFILFGGQPPSANTWAYDPEANTWEDLQPPGSPPYRDTYAMTYASVGGKAILFGGGVFPSGDEDMKLFNDTWSYDPAANVWTDLKPAGAVPSPRALASMVYDPMGKKVILFGGMDNTRGYNDTWSYDPATNKWTKLKPGGTLPAKRGGYAMTYDAVRRQVLLFGGMGETAVFNDTWSYDPAANTWTKVKVAGTVPSARYGMSMEYDAVSETVILFGGESEDESLLNDTWSYDPAAKTWTKADTQFTIPSARVGASMGYDPTNRAVILFGGAGDTGIMNDTWAFQNATAGTAAPKASGSPPPSTSTGVSGQRAPAGQVAVIARPDGQPPLNGGWKTDRIDIRVMPEYDEKAVLVIVRFSLPASVSLPATLEFPVPAGAQITGIGEVDPNGDFKYNYPDSLPPIKHGSYWDVATIVVKDYRDLQVDYYYDPGLPQGAGQRSFPLLAQMPMDSDELVLHVQEPIRAVDFQVEPGMLNSGEADDGFTYFAASCSDVKAGATLGHVVSYYKPDGLPSIGSGMST